MAVIRVEPVKDEASGLYYIEIYNPQDASAPFVTTEPRCMTAAAAENDVIRRDRDARRGHESRRG